MAVLFVSHSSRDDAAATALEAWLRANGFTDIFVDHHSLAGGDKWQPARLCDRRCGWREPGADTMEGHSRWRPCRRSKSPIEPT